ncbi:SDR family oxidoreductase [Shewanella algae]|uniref:SDR family oxidoreductase n=1 Tax=Shewanella algae TaxID=38313 RepID=UPI0031F4BD87
MELKYLNVIITGASGGIGSAIARALAAKGARLLLCGRDQAKLDALKQSLAGEHHTLSADLTSSGGQCQLRQAAGVFCPKVLINCLGVNQLSMLEASDTCDTRAMMAVNLEAPINCCRTLLPLLKRQSEAAIINVGSILGSIGYPGSSLYCASKFGLRGFTEALERELADSKIKVLYFAPRATDTELNTESMRQLNSALGNRQDSPEWVADILCRDLADNRRGRRFIGWPEKLFVRINALLPGLVNNDTRKKLPLIRQFCQRAVPIQDTANPITEGEKHEAI